MNDSSAVRVSFENWTELIRIDTTFSTLWVYSQQDQQLEIVNMSDDGKSITTSLSQANARALYEALKREFDDEKT
jgi:hypothetical protein